MLYEAQDHVYQKKQVFSAPDVLAKLVKVYYPREIQTRTLRIKLMLSQLSECIHNTGTRFISFLYLTYCYIVLISSSSTVISTYLIEHFT